MRKISADYIFTMQSEPIKNGVITLDESGIVMDVSEKTVDESPSELEFYEGIICPGFINTHCHLELSHLRSQISENAGMTGFIRELLSKRFNFSDDQIKKSIADAEAEMVKNGIVAVGDISNNTSTFSQKSQNNLYYHTFIEIFDLDPGKAESVFSTGLKLTNELFNQHPELSSSIAAHAPYTMSEKLLKLINDYSAENKKIGTIHNQESETESELFISQSGAMADAFRTMGLEPWFRKTGINSLRSTLPFLNDVPKLLLVHNTFTSKDDLEWIENNMSAHTDHLYWCTCPNANLYIEGKLPDYDLFVEKGLKMTIGTDSLASNWSLSVLDELKTIAKYYPHISTAILLTWATKNGADFLGLNHLGTIEKGKKPGLNWLKNVGELKISEKTEVVKLA